MPGRGRPCNITREPPTLQSKRLLRSPTVSSSGLAPIEILKFATRAAGSVAPRPLSHNLFWTIRVPQTKLKRDHGRVERGCTKWRPRKNALTFPESCGVKGTKRTVRYGLRRRPCRVQVILLTPVIQLKTFRRHSQKADISCPLTDRSAPCYVGMVVGYLLHHEMRSGCPAIICNLPFCCCPSYVFITPVALVTGRDFLYPGGWLIISSPAGCGSGRPEVAKQGVAYASKLFSFLGDSLAINTRSRYTRLARVTALIVVLLSSLGLWWLIWLAVSSLLAISSLQSLKLFVFGLLSDSAAASEEPVAA